MKKARKIIALLLALVFAVSLCACGKTPAAPADPAAPAAPDASKDEVVTLTFANTMPALNPCEVPLNWVFTELYERSGGTIKIEYYSGATLLDPAGMYDGVKAGVADIGYLLLADNTGRFPELLMAEYPGIYFSSAPSITYAMKEYAETYKPAELEGIKVLAFQNGTLGMIASNGGPIRSPEDIKGQTIRALGNMAKSISAFGATPADVSIADCYESLRTGVLDGIMSILGPLEGFKLSEVVDYVMTYPLYNNCTMFFMNEDAFARLSPNQQAVFMEVWGEAEEWVFSRYLGEIEHTQKLVAHMDEVRSHGEVYYPTDEEIEAFAEPIRPIVEEYAASIDNGDEIYARWLELAEKWNAEYPYLPFDDPGFYKCTFPDTGERMDCTNPEWTLPY